LPSQLIQGVEARYALYELDAPARRAIKELWPAIAPVMEKAVEAILIASIQTAAGNTASASAEILSVEQAAACSASAFSEIADLTARVSARADDLESKVSAFFSRVRAA
jgi:hypothetical protein